MDKYINIKALVLPKQFEKKRYKVEEYKHLE